jgi:hypothetical protein
MYFPRATAPSTSTTTTNTMVNPMPHVIGPVIPSRIIPNMAVSVHNGAYFGGARTWRTDLDQLTLLHSNWDTTRLIGLMTARASFVKIRDHLVSGLADSASLAGPTSDALPMSDGPPYRAGIEPAGGAEQHSRLIFECAPNAMLMVGSAGVIVMVNAETEAHFWLFANRVARATSRNLNARAVPRRASWHAGRVFRSS